MASNESGAAYTPEQAKRALEDVSLARNRLVERAVIPWWYHTGIATGIALAIASFSLGHDRPSWMVPTGFILVPFALSWLLGKKTGVGLDFYRTTPSAIAPGGKWVATFVLLILGGAVVQWGFDVSWGFAVAGLLSFAATLFYSPRVTTAMLEDLRAGRTGH